VKETLVCSSCEKSWKREITRGRKPVLCPKCVKLEIADKEKQAKEKAKAVAKQEKTAAVNQKTTAKKQRQIAAEPQEAVASVNQEKNNEIKVSLSDVYRDYYPHPANYKEFIKATKGGSTWHCSICKKTLSSDVSLVVPPTHRCPPNSSKVREYERIK
jgi:rubrerythrin